jgi:hypothetical protein
MIEDVLDWLSDRVDNLNRWLDMGIIKNTYHIKVGDRINFLDTGECTTITGGYIDYDQTPARHYLITERWGYIEYPFVRPDYALADKPPVGMELFL